LRSLQEIQPDFEEAKACAGLWNQGKEEEEEEEEEEEKKKKYVWICKDPVSYSMGTVGFPSGGGKQTGREADDSPPSSPDFKNTSSWRGTLSTGTILSYLTSYGTLQGSVMKFFR
jgi:hypothetical protein